MITLEKLEALRDRLCKEKDDEKHHPDWKEGHIIGALDMFNGVVELMKGGENDPKTANGSDVRE